MDFERFSAQYLSQARNGDVSSREMLLSESKPFIKNTCIKVCNRPLDWGRDDELSIGLMALNEAIDRYQETRKIPFLPFARLVIKSRLADYFRSENRHRHQPLEIQDREGTSVLLETEQAWENYLREAEVRERQEEVLEFQRELLQYGITVSDLVEASPKHRDSRQALINVVKLLANDKSLLEQLLSTKRLPVKELVVASGLHRKTIEKSRRYIVAMALLQSKRESFIYLYSYLKYSLWKNEGV